jgi:8-amino-7-oxononanoate synthase
VVVGTDRLGTLSHCLLALEALAAAAVPALGVVLAAPEVSDDSTGGNAAALRRSGVERVATLPRLVAPFDAAAAASGLSAVVRWIEEWLAQGAEAPATPEQAWAGWLDGALEARRERNLLRELRPIAAESPVRGRLAGRPVVAFAGNDYLGLSSHPAVREAAAAAARGGMGPRAAPLVCGHCEEHAALEAELASLAAAEAALLFANGWAANTGLLAALAGPDLAVFSDQLNHASIIDGCAMAARRGAEVRIYRHADPGHLEELLAGCRRPRRLVVTDSVFSMDGDLAPLRELVALKERHGALLAVDEAHATLVLGDQGGGAAEALGVSGHVDLHVGTLSKAVGALGGFVACSARLRSHLLNAARPFVYSTALPLPVVAAARAALAVRRAEPQLVARLFAHTRRLAAVLGAPAATPILPLRLGAEHAALAAAEALLGRGFWVPAIRPPTVPPGTARLRVTVSAAHSEDEVDGLAAALDELGLSAAGRVRAGSPVLPG